ncbi:MAG: hypothetical protein ABSE68_01560 [Minisyncoccia bacterium]
MIRGQKKFLYGLFYIIIFGLIIWAFIPSSNVPTPTPVANSSQSLPLQLIEVPWIFKSESTKKVVFLAQVKNPNAEYGAERFSFAFSVLDRNGNVLNKVSGTDKILPSETRYVVYNLDTLSPDLFQAAVSADFKISDSQFAAANKFLAPSIAVVSGPDVSSDGSKISVTATIKNQSTFPVAAVKATVVIGNKYGDPVSAGETLIQNLGGFEERQVTVYFPADQELIQEAAARKPEIFLNGE